MYWTKRAVIYDEKTNLYQAKGDLEVIKYTISNAVPDGDGFEVDLNGIEFIDYIERPNHYEIVNGKLYSKTEPDCVNSVEDCSNSLK